MKLNVITIILCAILVVAVDLSIHNVHAQQAPTQHENNSETVTTQELRLVDKKGHLRAILNSDGMTIKDNIGNNRIQIGFSGEKSDEEPEINLFDKKGHELASMQILLGSPQINLSDENGNPLASLAILAGQPGLELSTPKDKLVPAGAGNLRLSALASGPYITFYNEKEQEVMDFSALPYDIPRIKAYNGKHKLIWQKP